ncbi:MAG: putative baseplate assembly protein [Terriglobales bacterium]
MKQPCGCCAGLEAVTPELEANRPGLSALVYRAGTYATFLETMLVRISSIYLDVPASDGSGKLQRIFPLNGLVLNSDGKTFSRFSAGLSTRELNDPSIALLDAWATVADVLTFYEERIANEGYLRTATERQSILELARLVGYKLRSGISSSVYLAFTVSDGFNGIIPSGTRAQSIPGTGEKPQPFETYIDLPARDVWNNLKPRLTRPQVITMASSPSGQTVSIDQGTDATTRDTLYFAGLSTNLNVGDALLIVSGDGAGQQCLRIVESVSAQPDQKRTEVSLQVALPTDQPGPGGSQQALTMLQSTLGPFIADATNIFGGGDLAIQVASILQTLISEATALVNGNADATATDVADLLPPVIPEIQEKHDIAVRRGFTRLEPWISDIVNSLTSLVEQIPSLDDARGTVTSPAIDSAAVDVVPPGLSDLFGIADQLALPPSLQPANTFRLTRSVQRVFAPESDIAPRLLATFRPAIASTLYKAWGSIQTPASPIQVFAMRVKAALFGNNAPLQVTYTVATTGNPPTTVSTPSYSEWPVNEPGTQVDLDSNYPKIAPNSWIVVETTNTNITKLQTQYAKTGSPTVMSRGDYGMSGKTTRIQLVVPDDPSRDVSWITTSPPTGVTTPPDFQGVRQTIVYAQPEELVLAEEPLDRDVEGSTIELDALYDGLESGRWIIVSGNRTDITDSTGATNATGVAGNELVMISQVTQGPGKQSCVPLTIDAVPFASVYSVVGPNPAGDLLVVGAPNAGIVQFLANFSLTNAPGGNLQICNPVQLAPGLYANTYLPTAKELNGDFSLFGESIPDPQPGNPPFGGVIPSTRFDPATNKFPVFAWRIASLASGNDTLHTNLVLANSLAYVYDSSTVTMYGNVVKATHGQTQGEVLGDGNASQALQKFPLHQSPLTYLPAPTPSGADSTLVVRVNEIEWQEADNLFVLGPSDRKYITQTDDSDKTTAITGNGEHGLRVPTGTANVKAVYRSGTGRPGNVNAQQISQLATQPLGVKSVINPLRAAGGADGDTRDQARRNVSIGLTALDRLVSVQDYADFARRFAGIGKASARRLTDGRKLLVHLTIAGKDDIPIDPTTDLYQALLQALAQAGDPHQPVEIALRRLKVLVITAGVKIQPAYTWESVAANLRSTLLDLYSFDRRELGQSAFLSEAVSTMQAVAGVQYVDMQKFDSVSESVTAAQLASLATTLTLNSFVEAELAHVEPTELDPAKRIKPAELVILTPDIPDTLILTEITT